MYTIKVLAADDLGTETNTTIYELPATSSSAIVQNVRVNNVNTSASRTIKLFFKRGSEQVQLINDTTVLAGKCFIYRVQMNLLNGDLIQITTSGNLMNFIICGVENY